MFKYRKFTDDEIKQICKNMVIICDTREKSTHIKEWLSYKNRCEFKDMKLDHADYSFMVKAIPELGILEDMYFDKIIAIERKNSLDELSQNFTKNRTRFEEELSMFKGKMVVIIEDSWDNLFTGTYSSEYNRQAFIGTLQSFEHRYGVSFKFMSEKAIPVYIFTFFYYFLRSTLKGEQ
jgi:hypothetical protein